VDLLLVGRFLVAIRNSGGSLDGDSGAGHAGHDDFSIGGCGPSLVWRRRQPKWWGRRHEAWTSGGDRFVMVVRSWLTTALVSMEEGETT
jgi:hypothetical protein